MIQNTLIALFRNTILVFFALQPFIVPAQEDDVSKMSHGKLRDYLKEHGLKTSDGHLVNVGDTLYIAKGTMPDKKYAFIYQSQTAVMSKTSEDGSTKAYLNSSAKGRMAIVKAFMTSGMRKGQYSIFTVVGVGEPINYWIELDNAIEAGEIKLTK
ncbi:MAG TPA: hypothetical protein VGE58_06015 [Daejeonella sp.]